MHVLYIYIYIHIHTHVLIHSGDFTTLTETGPTETDLNKRSKSRPLKRMLSRLKSSLSRGVGIFRLTPAC